MLNAELSGKARVGLFPFRIASRSCAPAVPLESYHRAEFLGILADQLPSNYRPHFGKRLVSYTDSPSGPVTLHFKDGTTATCDVLIAADGIKSTARRAMYEKLAESESDEEKAEKLRGFVKAKWTGQYVYRGLVPREKVEEVCPDHPALSGPVYVGARICQSASVTHFCVM